MGIKSSISHCKWSLSPKIRAQGKYDKGLSKKLYLFLFWWLYIYNLFRIMESLFFFYEKLLDSWLAKKLINFSAFR